mgnify:CR=1 FL=1
MAEKDISEKMLESYNDVFADIVNVLLFDGKEVMKPEDLEDQAPRSAYKADGKLREVERDVAKRWKNGSVRIACIGVENQTAIDPLMPLRVIGYDGAEYRAQYGTAGSKYPVVTFVLYFGLEKEWEKEISLKECFDILPELEEYVNDYKVKVFSIAFLPPEKVQQFKSDFQIVADYFVQKHMTQNYIPNPQTLVHVQETLQLLSIMGNDNRFEKAYNSSAEGGPHNMCDVLDRVEKQGVDLMAKLMSILFKEKRFADAERASEDEAYREKLLKEYNLKQ